MLSLAASLAHGQSGSQRQAELGAINPARIAFNSNGGLQYLLAANVAPGCGSSSTLDPATAAQLVACFFQSAPGLLSENGEDLRQVPWEITKVLPPDPHGVQIVRLSQTSGGLPVKGGELVLGVADGILRSVAGRLFPPSVVPQNTPVGSAAATRALAAASLGGSIEIARRYYDPTVGSVVSVFRKPNSGEMIAWREDSNLEIRRWPNSFDLNLTTRHTNVQKYDKIWATTDSPYYLWIEEEAVQVDLHPQGDEEEHDLFILDHGSDENHGEPKLCRSPNSSNCSSYPNPEGSPHFSVALGACASA